MRLNLRRACLALATALLLGATLAATPARASGPSVDVLVDFGDGGYTWFQVALPEGNATALKATEAGLETSGLPPMEVTWFNATFCARRPCALVEAIGGRVPTPPAWWHLFLWNATSAAWELSPLGPSDLDLRDGDSVAWYLAVDDPITYASPLPAPTPRSPHVWTSFRGALDNAGRAAGSLAGPARMLWERDVGVLEIDTTPVVAGGSVFVGTRTALVALDADSGRERWRNGGAGSLLSTPAYHDGRLILGGTDGRLRSVDAATGTEVWSVLLEPGAVSTGIASSPAVFEGRAYVGVFNESGGSGRVVSVHVRNGTVAWSYETGSVHMSQPAVRAGRLYVGVMGRYDGVVGYAPPHGLLSLGLDGSGPWFLETEGPVASSPVLAGGLAFFTSKDGHVYAVTEGGDLAWRREVGASTSSPAFADGRLFVASGGLDGSGLVRAFDAAGGELWSADPGAGIQASLVSDGRVVCGSTNEARGRHFCLAAEDGTPTWSFTPVPPQYILGSPVIVGDRLYAVSDNGRVYAFAFQATAPGGGSADPALVGVLVLAVSAAVVVALVPRRRKGDPRA